METVEFPCSQEVNQGMFTVRNKVDGCAKTEKVRTRHRTGCCKGSKTRWRNWFNAYKLISKGSKVNQTSLFKSVRTAVGVV